MTKKFDYEAIKKAASTSSIQQQSNDEMQDLYVRKVIEYKQVWHDKIKDLLKERGKRSVNGFIREAIREKLLKEDVNI